MATKPAAREIRVFLSSTFQDMEAERDYLLTHVFPVFRALCLERLVTFTEIDLRWGITEEETKNGHTVQVCLNEIDRCREIKPPPFFIGFLGERYGWVPKPEEVGHYWGDQTSPYHSRIKVALDEGISVTELEMRVALLEPSPEEEDTRGKIFLRSPKLTDVLARKAASDGSVQCFYDRAEGRLDHLKSILRSTPYMGLDNYDSVEAFGESVKKFLIEELDRWFPADALPNSEERITRAHELYALSRKQAYVPFCEVEDQVIKIFQDGAPNAGCQLVQIVAPSGYGKSSFLSHLATRFAKDHNATVFSHFVGVDGFPELSAWRERLITFLCNEGDIHFRLPIADQERWDSLPYLLSEFVKKTKKPLILLLDAINQFTDTKAEAQAKIDSKKENRDKKSSDQIKNDIDAAVAAEVILRLESLTLPKGVMLVVSSTPKEALSKASTITLPAFDQVRRESAIKKFLHLHSKNFSGNLPTDLMPMLVSAPACDSPLFLRMLLEELRIHARYQTLTEKTHELLKCQTPYNLFQNILSGMDQDFKDDKHSDLATSAVQLMTASLRGLRHSDLGKLLASEKDPVEHEGGSPRLPDQILVPLLANLAPFCLNDDGRMSLMHDSLRQTSYRPHGKRRRTSWPNIPVPDTTYDDAREKLLEYFGKRSDIDAVAECLHQGRWLIDNILSVEWYESQFRDDDDIRRTYSLDKRIPILEKMLSIINHADFRDESDFLWTATYLAKLYKEQTSGSSKASFDLKALNLYTEILIVLRKTQPDDVSNITKILEELSYLYWQQGNHIQAQSFFDEALDIWRKTSPIDNIQLIKALNSHANFYQRHQWDSLALWLYKEALGIHSKMLPINKGSIGQTLVNIASLFEKNSRFKFSEKLYRKALNLFRKSEDSKYKTDILNVVTKIGDLRSMNNDYLNAAIFYKEALHNTLSQYNWENYDTILVKLLDSIDLYKDSRHSTEAEGLYRTTAETLYNAAILIFRKEYDRKSNSTVPIRYFKPIRSLRPLTPLTPLTPLMILFCKTLKMMREIHPADNVRIMDLLKNLGSLYATARRYVEAEEQYKEYIDIFLQITPKPHFDLVNALERLAEVYIAQYLYDKSEPLLLQALDILHSNFPVSHVEIIPVLSKIARIYCVLDGKELYAEPFLLEILDITRHSFIGNNEKIISALKDLASFYERNKQLIKAEPLRKEILSIVEKNINSVSEEIPMTDEETNDLFESFYNLAKVYQDLGRNQDAEEFYLKALELARESFWDGDERWSSVLNKLVDLYKTQGRDSESKPLKLEAEKVMAALQEAYEQSNVNYDVLDD